MKKTLSLFFLLAFISLGGVYFVQKNRTLPSDFDALIMLWQAEQAKELKNIFGLWAETPVGTGERSLDFDISYLGLSFSGKISGPILSDIVGEKSLWNATVDMNGKNTKSSLPLPSNIGLKGPMKIGQGDFAYITPGEILVSLPSQSSALQKQLQDALSLAKDKTIKIADKNPSILQLSSWMKFFNDLTKKPIFLLVNSEGKISGRYEYNISLTPEYSDLFAVAALPMKNCHFSIATRNINDFILDCRSSDTRVVWSPHADKVAHDLEYPTTYELSLSAGEKPKWEFEIYENNQKKAEIEGHTQRSGNQLLWEIKTDNIPTGFAGTIGGQESRDQVSNLDFASPQSYDSWEEITKELVY